MSVYTIVKTNTDGKSFRFSPRFSLNNCSLSNGISVALLSEIWFEKFVDNAKIEYPSSNVSSPIEIGRWRVITLLKELYPTGIVPFWKKMFLNWRPKKGLHGASSRNHLLLFHFSYWVNYFFPGGNWFQLQTIVRKISINNNYVSTHLST